MTLNKAMPTENIMKVLSCAEKYSKEFKRGKIRTFTLKDEIYLRNKTGANKMDPEYKDKGSIE